MQEGESYFANLHRSSRELRRSLNGAFFFLLCCLVWARAVMSWSVLLDCWAGAEQGDGRSTICLDVFCCFIALCKNLEWMSWLFHSFGGSCLSKCLYQRYLDAKCVVLWLLESPFLTVRQWCLFTDGVGGWILECSVHLLSFLMAGFRVLGVGGLCPVRVSCKDVLGIVREMEFSYPTNVPGFSAFIPNMRSPGEFWPIFYQISYSEAIFFSEDFQTLVPPVLSLLPSTPASLTKPPKHRTPYPLPPP